MSIKRQSGVTLIELILFILIVGIALAAILGVMNVTTRNSADPARTKQALMIAEGLLEEVQLARFTKCDPSGDVNASGACTIPEAWGQVAPEPAGTRPYDNVNDYVAAADTATAAFNNGNGVLVDANDRALNVSGYTATVTITPEALGPSGSVVGTAGGTAADTDMLRIRVTVSFDNRSLALDGYRARYAPGI